MMARKSFLKVALIALLMVIGFSGHFSRAQNEESEEARQAAEKAKRRRYPGGRDEQELTVQAVLPVTSRYPTDPKAAPATPVKETPADDLHD